MSNRNLKFDRHQGCCDRGIDITDNDDSIRGMLDQMALVGDHHPPGLLGVSSRTDA